jgi:hypothetical protein
VSHPEAKDRDKGSPERQRATAVLSGRNRRSRGDHATTPPSSAAASRRRGACPPAEQVRPLRLLVGRSRAMSAQEQQLLVGGLAELLADWLTANPKRLPARLRAAGSPDLMDQPDAKERP